MGLCFDGVLNLEFVGMRRGQQEIVGFVLIVVLVMVGLMVFLVISIRSSDEARESLEVGNMLDAVMKQTSDCAIVYVPNYDDFEDLFKSCYVGDECGNLGVLACDYLNESLGDVVGEMMASEAAIVDWGIDFFVKDGEGILSIGKMGCLGSVSAAQRNIISGDESLVVRMRVCYA